MGKKQTAKVDTEPTAEGAQGSTVPAAERAWPHRVVDHVIAEERALGASRRPPAVSE